MRNWRANSVDPKVYVAQMAKTNYKGVTAQIQFTNKGELTKPAVTLSVYKNGVRTPLN